MTLFEMKEKKFSLEKELNTIKDTILEKSADPTYPIADLDEKKAKAEELKKRIAVFDESIQAEEDAQRKALAMKGGSGSGMTEDQIRTKAKADFYRAALTGGDVSKSYEALGGIPAATADLGNGDKLLPVNMSNSLLVEPFQDNSLRSVCQITNITGYEEPKLGFTIDDADIKDVTDQETANEIEMSGDTVVYGRHKVKVKATVKDTVLHGTNVDLVTTIENALRSALAIREKTFAFMESSDTDHDHMSFYLAEIKEIEGEDIIDAITKAWADLSDAYSGRASVMMRKQDYYAAVRTLANSSVDLWGKKPEDVLGIPVTFNDKAKKPVVGDFSFYGINYDIGTIYDTDKDVDKGEYKFVLTAWGDQQIRMKSAFRVAKVKENP